MITLLYVDDERDLLDICRIFLERYGDFSVTTVDSADMAIRELEKGTFDAIVSDYQMPDKDGIALLKEVREHFGSIPFILFTGRGREEVVIDAINNGADFYLQKGGDPSAQFTELAHKVRQATSRKKAQDELRAAYEQVAATEEELRQRYSELAKNEQLLRENEERSRRILEKMPLPLALVRHDGTVAFTNERFVEVFGYTIEECPTISSWWEKAYPDPDYRSRVRQQWEESVGRAGLEHADIRSAGYTITCKDGTIRVVEISGIALPDGFLATFIDTTERKKAEEALRRSEEHLRLFIQQAPVALAMFDRGMRYLAASRRWIADYQIGDREITGHSHYEIFPEIAESVRQVHRRCLAGETISSDEDRFVRLDGTVQWVAWEVHPWYEAAGGIGGIIIFSEDITMRKRAQEDLKESEEKYRTLVERASEVIAIIQDMRLVYVNPAMERLTGIPRAKLIGMPFLETAWPEDRELLRTRHQKRMAGENVPENYDFRMIGHGDRPRWLSLSVAKILWQGRPATLNMMTDITERKTAEAALRESERNYRNLVENSMSIIYMLAPDGTFSFVSPSWKTRLGHDPAEVTGSHYSRFIHPDDLPLIDVFLKKVAGERTALTGQNEYRIFHKDGSIHWHNSSVMPVFDEEGNLASFIGNAVDLTDRKFAEDALRESRAELGSILHGLPILQFVIGSDHRVRSWNRALEEYSGIPGVEVLGTDQQWRPFYPSQRPVLADLIVDGNLDGIYKWYGGKLKPSRYCEGAYEAMDFFPAMGKNGSWLSFTAAPVRNAEGRIIGAVETLEDVTERVTAARATEESEQMYRRILENMQDAYIRTDKAGIITMVNPSAARMYGYGSADEMIGLPATALYSGGGNSRKKAMEKLEKAGGIIDFSGDAPRKDGTMFGMSVNIQFVRDSEGRITGTEGIVRDVSERRSMEYAIQEANRKLGLLNSITRHDLLNKMTALQGFIQIAAAKEQDPEISRYLARGLEGFETVRRQIDFMKTYQELGVQSPDWSRLGSIVTSAGTELPVTFSCRDYEIFADPMLEKVFANLFDNARRHGGHVTEIRVTCRKTGAGLAINVADNGTGIPDNEKEKIFSKGYGKHSGFGLFLAREILGITAITIRETGEPGTGARFEILVPEGAFRFTENGASGSS